MNVATVDFQAPNAAEVFTKSLKETGFAIIENHPVSRDLIEKAYADWHAFFNLPEKEKEEFLFDPKTHSGFIPYELSETAKGHEVKDIKEFYHYFPWAPCPDNLKDLSQTLYDDLIGVAHTLLEWVEQETPESVSKNFSMPLCKMIEKSDYSLMRPIHYPPLKGDEADGAIRAAAHEDINILTVLPTGSTDGLQVVDTEGNWLPVKHGLNQLVVNIGDMLDECSGGYYKATTHRVVNPVGEEAKKARLAMPLFLHPRDEVVLSDRHTAASYRTERFAELGLNAEQEDVA